ncbi:hypothetical protein HK100_006656, partial [Physocladia obscura]
MNTAEIEYQWILEHKLPEMLDRMLSYLKVKYRYIDKKANTYVCVYVNGKTTDCVKGIVSIDGTQIVKAVRELTLKLPHHASSRATTPPKISLAQQTNNNNNNNSSSSSSIYYTLPQLVAFETSLYYALSVIESIQDRIRNSSDKKVATAAVVDIDWVYDCIVTTARVLREAVRSLNDVDEEVLFPMKEVDAKQFSQELPDDVIIEFFMASANMLAVSIYAISYQHGSQSNTAGGMIPIIPMQSQILSRFKNMKIETYKGKAIEILDEVYLEVAVPSFAGMDGHVQAAIEVRRIAGFLVMAIVMVLVTWLGGGMDGGARAPAEDKVDVSKADRQTVEAAQTAVLAWLDEAEQHGRHDDTPMSEHEAAALRLAHGVALDAAAQAARGSSARPPASLADFALLGERARAALVALRVARLPPHTQRAVAQRVRNAALVAQQQAVLHHAAAHTFPFLGPRFDSLAGLAAFFAAQPPRASTSTGIAFTCGNRQFYTTYHAILALRALACNLPVEVFYAGSADLAAQYVDAFNALPNVRAENLLNHFTKETVHWSGWSLKPFVILAASFRITLFMDSDVLFFKNPFPVVLNSSIFQNHGLLFFHDRRLYETHYHQGVDLFKSINRHPSKYAKSLGYLNEKGTHEMDSGFIAIDKGIPSNLFGLLAACKMNSQRERGVLYSKTYGDKESFWFGAELVRTSFEFNPFYGSVIGTVKHEFENSKKQVDGWTVVCGICLLQLDESGDPFWWNGGGVLQNRNPKSPDEFEFSNLTAMAFDLKGENEDGSLTQWLPGHCLNQSNKYVLDPLPDKYVTLLEEFRDIYRNQVKNVFVPPPPPPPPTPEQKVPARKNNVKNKP